MKVDGTTLHLTLHIQQAKDGTLCALIDSLDQDATNIPVKTVDFADTTLRLDIAQVSGTYVGVLSKDGEELKGVWSEGKDHKLTFKKVPDSITLTQPAQIGGDWEGSLIEAGIQKNVYLHINTTSCTTLVGMLTIPGAGGDESEIFEMTFQSGKLAFSINSLRVAYSATLTDGNTFDGVWKQGQPYPLAFHRASHPFRVYERPKGCRG